LHFDFHFQGVNFDNPFGKRILGYPGQLSVSSLFIVQRLHGSSLWCREAPITFSLIFDRFMSGHVQHSGKIAVFPVQNDQFSLIKHINEIATFENSKTVL